MNKTIAIGADIGGTHITCAAVDLESGSILSDTLAREMYSHQDATDIILRNWARALNHSLLKLEESRLCGIGFAIPGPFDYRNGISQMKHKFPHLYDIHIPTALNMHLLEDRDLKMRFLNDATAFAIGEAWRGNGQGCQKVVVITLGTGFGSAFLDHGIPVVTRNDVPKEGCLWHLPFKDAIADEYFSTRWFTNAYQKRTGKPLPNVKTLMDRVETEPVAIEIFEEFGRNLAECLGPWLKKFEAEILIVGGNISNALPLFEPAFQAGIRQAGLKLPVKVSQLMEKAAIIGSARLMDDAFWEKVETDLPKI